ncbi:MAG: site-2 protease family protein [Patescibacteria group bacterium]|nr:site-2 protease family protein [Patescibacteria group bacterium]
MLTLIVFIVVLSVLVLVHELGHFLAAKKIGVKVEEFGLGYPPRAIGKKVGETIYSLNWLPFGGFVRLFGENGEIVNSKQKTENKRAYYSRSKIERSLILTAGVFMNFVLGVVIISYLFTQGIYVPAAGVKVENVLPNTPAQTAGLEKGDVINSINGQKVNSPQDLIGVTKTNLGQTVALLIKRCPQTDNSKQITVNNSNNCQSVTISLVPRRTYPANEGAMGIAISTNMELKTYSLWEAPVLGTQEAFKLTWFILKGVGGVFWKLISSASVPKDVAGPVGIYQATGQAVSLGGLVGVLQLIGLLSLNLAVVNILPIPALDGGRLFLILVEIFIGKKRTARIEGVAQSIGVVLIMTLIVLITINDLSKISFFQNLLQRFKSAF